MRQAGLTIEAMRLPGSRSLGTRSLIPARFEASLAMRSSTSEAESGAKPTTFPATDISITSVDASSERPILKSSRSISASAPHAA